MHYLASKTSTLSTNDTHTHELYAAQIMSSTYDNCQKAHQDSTGYRTLGLLNHQTANYLSNYKLQHSNYFHYASVPQALPTQAMKIESTSDSSSGVSSAENSPPDRSLTQPKMNTKLHNDSLTNPFGILEQQNDDLNPQLINARDFYDQTALHCLFSNVKMSEEIVILNIRKLVKYGADIDAQDNSKLSFISFITV